MKGGYLAYEGMLAINQHIMAKNNGDLQRKEESIHKVMDVLANLSDEQMKKVIEKASCK